MRRKMAGEVSREKNKSKMQARVLGEDMTAKGAYCGSMLRDSSSLRVISWTGSRRFSSGV